MKSGLRQLVLGLVGTLIFSGGVLVDGAPITRKSLAQDIDKIIRLGNLDGTTFGIVITDLDGQRDLYTRHADTALTPASNMKLLTTAAALKMLGPKFVFKTKFSMVGKELVIQGDGDPAVGDPVLLNQINYDVDMFVDHITRALKKQKIGDIDSIVVDDRVFDDQHVHPNWPRRHLDRWYGAAVAGINFNDNCLDVFAAPAARGKKPSVSFQPKHAPVLIDNQAKSGSNNALQISRRGNTNRILLRGTVRHQLVKPESVPIHDPSMYFGGTIQRSLKAAGVTVKGVRRAGREEIVKDGRPVFILETTLGTVLHRTNRDSMNNFAEALLKRIGHELTHKPGSWKNGAAAVRRFLITVLGTDTAQVIIDDGSGLSPNNRVSPRAIIRLLAHMHGQKNLGGIFMASLAKPSDKRGTLAKRFRGVNLKTKLHAKTGYISGVLALSGYMRHHDRTYAFSMIANKGRIYNARKAMDKIIVKLDKYVASQTPRKIGG